MSEIFWKTAQKQVKNIREDTHKIHRATKQYTLIYESRMRKETETDPDTEVAGAQHFPLWIHLVQSILCRIKKK